MILMFKDIQVFRFTMSKNNMSFVTIYNEKYIPKSLMSAVKDTNTIKNTNIPINNYYSVCLWLSARVLLMARRNSKKIVGSASLPQPIEFFDCVELSLKCRALSVTDCYWIKEDNEKIQWSNVNIRQNSLSDVVKDISLLGISARVHDERLVIPEATTLGTAAKGWISDNGKLKLLKGDNYDSLSIYKEYCSSLVLDCLNIKHVDYKLTEYKGLIFAECDCIVTEDYSIVTASDVLGMFEKDRQLFLEFVIQERFKEDFYKMVIADFLIANDDRHFSNWGFFMDNSTMELISLHPLFDHDNAFDEIFNIELHSKVLKNETYYSAMCKAVKEVDIQIWKEFPYQIIGKMLGEKYLESFRERVDLFNKESVKNKTIV